MSQYYDVNILLIAPLLDKPTYTSNIAVSRLLEFSKRFENVKIDLLWGINANKSMFNYYINKKRYNAVFYWGHGIEDAIKGNKIIGNMINKRNILKARNIPFDVMACYTAKDLGKYAVAHGIPAYIGTDDVYFAAFREKERDFLEDWIDYTLSRQKALIEGKTFGEAYSIFVKKASYYISLYKTFGDYKNYDWYYKTTKHNLKHTILIGEPEVSLYNF